MESRARSFFEYQSHRSISIKSASRTTVFSCVTVDHQAAVTSRGRKFRGRSFFDMTQSALESNCLLFTFPGIL